MQALRAQLDRSGYRRCLVMAAVSLVVMWATGCSAGSPITTELHPGVQRPDRGAVIFLCDGLCPDEVVAGSREGRLPNLRRRFVEGGTGVTDALSPVPSITYAAITTLLTGTTPAQHSIIGNEWFEPAERGFCTYKTAATYRTVNADFDIPTLYERLEPTPSVNVQTAVKRGVTRNFANWAMSGVRWYFGNYTAVDKLTASTLEDVVLWANAGGVWPRVLTMYFPGCDEIGHRFGPASEDYAACVAHLDVQIGRVCDWLDEAGLLETTTLVLVSDHGMAQVAPERIIDLVGLIEQWGRRITDEARHGGSWQRRAAFYDRFDTVLVDRVGRRAMLYFAGPDGWDAPADADTVTAILTAPPAELQLWNRPGMLLVAWLTADGAVALRGPGGAGRIEERPGLAGVGAEFRYVPETGDPLGYLADPYLAEFVASGFHDDRAWLRATARQHIPDVVPHLGPLLRNARCGQVLAFPEDSYGFAADHRGSHGGITRDDARATLYFAGPGITPGGTIAHGRLVDVMPSLLVRLGEAAPGPAVVAGVPLLGGDEARDMYGE